MSAQPIHRMHLKGPWQFEWLSGPFDQDGRPITPVANDPGVLMSDSRIRMPASWQSAFGIVCGTAKFSRRFHKPTNLDPNERVHIAFDGIRGKAKFALNGSSIEAQGDASSFDVTERLVPSNLLTVEITVDAEDLAASAGLYAAVAIDIYVIE